MHRVRSAGCGVRSSTSGVGAPVLALPFRTPHSTLHTLLLLTAACTPVTTRPDFKPDPRALVVILNARPERVTPGIDSLVRAESLEVQRVNVLDGYVETAWYDPGRRRSYLHGRDIADLPATVKIRCWADPWVPGQTRLTVEPVYRPRVDPSRAERDLELIVPPEHGGYKVAQQLIEKLKQRFGTPQSAR
jgi:hypothetical protein